MNVESSRSSEMAESDPRTHFGAAVALLLVVGLFAGAIAAVRTGMPEAVSTTTMGVTGDAPPIEPEALTPAVAALYQHAADHPDTHRAVPCYCGCDSFADHTNLYDCFVRRDGMGYDAHAAGCAICQAEAREVQRLVNRGRTAPQIRNAIIDQFGPATNPAAATDA